MNSIERTVINPISSSASQNAATSLTKPHNSAQQERVVKSMRDVSTVTDSTSTSSSSTDSSTITASDFLTLLVSELQNQDPTQPTDPNAYITQLVGVNSLQQLISINQGITALDTTATTAPSTSISNP